MNDTKPDKNTGAAVASDTAKVRLRNCEIVFFCESLFFALGEETRCGNLAQYIFDEGEEGEMYVCEKCAKNIHISRLTGIAI